MADDRGTRIVMVNCDLGMISQIVQVEVSALHKGQGSVSSSQ